MESPVVVTVGTRPEAIKLLLLYKELHRAGVPVVLCSTDQHSELLTQVFDLFKTYPDISLGIMVNNQDLFHITSTCLEKIKLVFSELNPSMVIVQGDTTTAFASALASFYLKIPIAHVEAGLRSGNINSPYPEEFNRATISQIADYNFVPTYLNCANLLSCGISRSKIFLTGNTVVDALFWIKNKITSGEIEINSELRQRVEQCLRERKKIVLFTAHRRESFGDGILKIFRCIKTFAAAHKDVQIFYPSHPNPNIQKALSTSRLNELSNIFISGPILYQDLVYLLLNSDFILTDSGGIQEEAMSLGKYVLILRNVTERLEGVWDGLGRLVGTDESLLMKGLEDFYSQGLQDRPSTVFGDGQSVSRIVNIVKTKLIKNNNFSYGVFGGKRMRDYV